MEDQQEECANKRQRTSAAAGPIVRLNVGGSDRNIRRSLLVSLCEASNSNPLCHRLLDEHWSNSKCPVETITDDHGSTRLYLDRNPAAFDDFMSYIEYGVDFIKGICKQDIGARLAALRRECDYFTVKSFSRDLDVAMYGEPVSLGVNDWVKIAAECTRDAQGNIRGWRWSSLTGNERLISKYTKPGYPPGIAEVYRSGTYLVFFSLQTMAVTALLPNHGYPDDSNDEFCSLSIFRDALTNSDESHWTITLTRCGAFDYRTDIETRANRPLFLTASCADLVSLREGNIVYCSHGHGIERLRESTRIQSTVGQYSAHKSNPGAVNYMIFVKLSGGSIAKFNVVMTKDEPTIIKWKSGNSARQTAQNMSTNPVCIDSNDDTRICFNISGYYIIIGRIAAQLKKKHHRTASDEWYHNRPRVILGVHSSFETPLQILPEVVSFPANSVEWSYNNKMAEYGHINDVIYADQDSYLTIKGVDGACFSKHGTLPILFDKIPTQSISVMRIDPLACIDRYVVSSRDYRLGFQRALGGDTSQHKQLFSVESDKEVLIAKRKLKCIVFGSICSMLGSNASIFLNDEAVIHSQLCSDSGRGSHCLNGILDLQEDDRVSMKCRCDNSYNWDDKEYTGHLAFVQFDE